MIQRKIKIDIIFVSDLFKTIYRMKLCLHIHSSKCGVSEYLNNSSNKTILIILNKANIAIISWPSSMR